jgi:ribosomal peptide maturation radical SAM protein 1
MVNELVSRYELDKADVVGATSMFFQNVPSLALLRKVKELNPGVITVMGGANCEFPMGPVVAKRFPGVDFVFSGPGLKSFPEFLQHSINGDMDKCSLIRGVFSKNAPCPESGPATVGEELPIDFYVEPDYEPFVSLYEATYSPTQVPASLPFETSRGCWWGERSHCTFCGLNSASMNYRAMNPELAVKQFNYLFSFSGRVPRLLGVDNILPKNYASQVLPLLETPENMYIYYEVKADLTEQDLAALARARVTHVQPGIESIANSTLKLMKKGTTSFQNLKLLKLCALYDIKVDWNLLIGFPGEDEQVYRRYTEFIPLLYHLHPPTGSYPVRFDRFSPYYNQAESYGLNLHPLDFYSLIYPFEEADLRNLAYYFADRNLNADYFRKVAKWIGKVRESVSQWRARWSNGLPPRLYFKNNSNAIYDSRTGTAFEYALENSTKSVLDYLSRPARMDDVAKIFSSHGGVDVTKELRILIEKRLVFQEGDRLFSLVNEGNHGSKRNRPIEDGLPTRQTHDHPLVQVTLN